MQLPKAMLKAIPKEYFEPSTNTLKLLWEDEWRGIGITQVSSKAMRRHRIHTHRFTESGLGALRSPRTRAPHPSFQVSIVS